VARQAGNFGQAPHSLEIEPHGDQQEMAVLVSRIADALVSLRGWVVALCRDASSRPMPGRGRSG
jgi:hypothetical protein